MLNNDPFIYTSGSESPEIRASRFDRTTNALTPLHSLSAGPGSGYLALERRGRFVYGINRRPSRVLAFAVEDDGNLRSINQVVVPDVHGATHLALHPGGRFVAVAHFGSGHVSVHPLADDGAVGAPVDVQATPPEAHQAVFTPDGRFLFVPCRTGGVVCQFVVDGESGRLRPNDPAVVPSAAGAGPRHMALHPSLRFAFVLNELDGTMTSLRLDADRGTLTPIETVPSVPAGFQEGAAAHVEVAGGGRFVYGSNRQHGSIAMWAFDEDQGRLRLLGHEMGGGRISAPRDFTVDGERLLVANQKSELLLVFRIQPDGRLDLVASPSVQMGATFVGVLSPRQ